MSAAARSVLVFGLYMLGQGAVLVVAPNVLLGLVGVPPAQDAWVRVVGFALGVLGTYYVQAARHELTAFFRWTVPVRHVQFGFFCALVATGLASPMLLAFSAVELASGVWTALALRRESASQLHEASSGPRAGV